MDFVGFIVLTVFGYFKILTFRGILTFIVDLIYLVILIYWWI